MYDVLIVGGGAAGIRAAVAAAGTDPRLRIAMVSKVYPMRSHTVSAEGGAAAVLREDDSLDGHAFDTIKGSDYLADQDVVEYFVQQAPHEINQLERWGCPWSREPDGSISVRPFGGMTTWRTCFAADKTGFHMLHALFQTSLQYTQVVRHDESFVTSLLVEDGRCLGVTAMDARTGTVEALRARAVILATGGAGRIYSFTTNAAICTGDGMALAYRAGAPLKDMEFVQFHPTGLPHTGILITEAVRGEGGYLLNKEGERFLERYVPTRMELGPRDIISRAIITEFEAGRGYEGPYGNYVHLDVRHLGERTIDEKLPFARELARNYIGIDPVTEAIPVRPVVHYMMGGVHTDADGATPLAGLYAAGECANVGLNGANRLGSNSLPECLVFGARAGSAAARYALEQPTPAENPVQQLAAAEAQRVEQTYLQAPDGRAGSAAGGERVATIREALQETMERGAGVFRTGDGLRTAVGELGALRERLGQLRLDDRSRRFNTELFSALELEFMVDVAEAVAASALAREESRGSHARRDFPERDDDRFLAHTMAYRQPGGPPRLEYLPVRITRWEPQARTY
ncbi:MAG TPA: FAD-binding protein [Chloroflexota bacterium]|nr:FAD-binding protein [Chloroflexota bacterium]